MAANLPQNIIINILLHLPFESIVTCKLLSKQWKDLINNPKFFNRYNSRSSLSIFFETGLYCVLIRHGNKSPGTVLGRHYPFFTVHRLPIDLIRGTEPERCKHGCQDHDLLSQSSSGMVCTHVSNGEFLIYNLFNGASYAVSNAPFRQHYYYVWLCFGFGYDPYDEVYKIVVVCRYEEDERKTYKGRIKIDFDTVQNDDNSLFWVYSLRNLVWKPLKGFPYAVYDWGVWSFRPRACSFNGFLHWVVTLLEIPNKQVIVTYDLNTCRFGEISVPENCKFLSEDCEVAEVGWLGELDGNLCYWDELEFSKIDVWVMKEYGYGESWTPLISFSRKACLGRKTSDGYITPTGLYECRNGRKGVLFVSHYEGALYWCDLDRGKSKVVEVTTWCKREGNKQIGEQDLRYIKKCFVG